MLYSQSQVLLLFFLYGFLGWVWEVLLVSIERRHWVNRGFLYGPVLPIYGFGAFIIQWLTSPVQDNPLLVFLIGMAGVTLLEYVTGVVMDHLFHVRYWDYSSHRFNIKGHISLIVSLGWGVLAVLLVNVLHPPIDSLLKLIPAAVAEPLSLILTILFVVDVTKSVQAALDVKELLARLTESNERFAALVDQFNGLSARAGQSKEAIQTRLSLYGDSIKQKHEERPGAIELLRQRIDSVTQEIQSQIEQSASTWEQSRLSAVLSQLHDIKSELTQFEIRQAARRAKDYLAALKLIRRNPTSVSQHFKEALDEIKSHINNDK